MQQLLSTKKKRVGDTFITRCRFGFTRQECTTDVCMKLSHRKMYTLPRSPRINNYNPLLLMLWKANMFVSESTLVIANYVTKAECSNMQDLWQEVSSHTSIYSKLWPFGIRSLRSRECFLYEASDILLGAHLCEKSKTVKWVTYLSHTRRLIDHSNWLKCGRETPIFSKETSSTRYILLQSTRCR